MRMRNNIQMPRSIMARCLIPYWEFRLSRVDDGTYEIKQGSTYSGISTKLKGFTDNGLVLGLLSKFGIEDCASVSA